MRAERTSPDLLMEKYFIMAKFFSRRNELVFLGIALGLFGIIVGYAVYTISFLTMHVNDVLRPSENEGQLIEHFNFDKLNQLLGGTLPPPGL